MTEAISSTPAAVSDELFAKVQEHFNEQQIVELAATIAMENYRARVPPQNLDSMVAFQFRHLDWGND